MNKILITICGRGGSKGIPGKNIKEINKKPLIGYSIETAISFSKLYPADIALSTDSLEIKKTAAVFGLATEYVRPAKMATDDAGKLVVIKDLLAYYEHQNNIRYDYIIDLDITSPLRTIDDLSIALKNLVGNNDAVNLFSVSNAHRNPYFNMVEEQTDGFYNLVKKGKFLTRQSAPKVYDLNASFYIFKRSFFENYTTSITDKSIIYEMPHLCFDLDEPTDFDFLEFLLQEKKLNFKI
ncbi:MAG: acylneuraminate cytidylyltransferase family protein [Bacteroidia bacterium]